MRVERNRRYVSRVSGDALTAEVVPTLTPRDGGTQLELSWTGTGKTPLLRVLLPFMRRKIARQALADLVKLKDLVEGQPRRGSNPPPVRPLDQAANQEGRMAIRILGFAPEDIRHIVITHLHFDHAGGLPDFPHAQVHVHRRELEAMRHPRTWIELAYDRSDFAHQPARVLYEQPNAQWLGLEAIRLPFSPEMYLVPLFGHARGHYGVAIQDDGRWLFHCTDALPTNAQFDITSQWPNRLVLGPHVPRLQAWASAHPDVRLLAGHMWTSFFEGERDPAQRPSGAEAG